MGGHTRFRAARALLTFAIVLVALLSLAAPAGAATLDQARQQLLGWGLNPGPLFPSAVPVGFEGTTVTVSRFSGIDFDVTFARPDCSGTNFCVDYRRLPWKALDDILHDPVTTSAEPLQIGARAGYAVATGHSGAPSMFAWHEQGRTYMAIERYVELDQALQDLRPLVESLQPLPAPAVDPCNQRWANGRSTRVKGGRLVYDRSSSLNMVCHGFGTNSGGLHVHWLSWGMQCALLATALGARYGEQAEFLANGACAIEEIRRHPGLVSGIGAACSTAASLLGLQLRVVGELAGLACAGAPQLGTAFGTKLEADHEFRVARDVMRKQRCLEYRKHLGVSSWHAVRCRRV